MSGFVCISSKSDAPRDYSHLVKRTSSRGGIGPVVYTSKSTIMAQYEREHAEYLSNNLENTECRTKLIGQVRIDNASELSNSLSISDTGKDYYTRIIVAAYRRLGAECVARIIGDFCFVLYDSEKESLLFARDHFGVKPLFYRETKDAILIATEAKHIGDNRTLSPSDGWVADYVCGLPTYNCNTLIADVVRLMPGHCAQYRAGKLTQKRYWS